MSLPACSGLIINAIFKYPTPWNIIIIILIIIVIVIFIIIVIIIIIVFRTAASPLLCHVTQWRWMCHGPVGTNRKWPPSSIKYNGDHDGDGDGYDDDDHDDGNDYDDDGDDDDDDYDDNDNGVMRTDRNWPFLCNQI